MPRNITVTFADGSQHVYANAPDDIDPDAVSNRAQNEFNKPVASLDGGNPAAAAPAPTRQFNKFSGASNSQAQGALKVATDNFNASLDQRGLQGPDRAAALARFQSDPRYQALAARAQNQAPPTLAAATASRPRLQGTLTPKSTDQAIADSAAERSDQNVANSGNFLTALKAGIINSTMGLGTRLAAAGEAYLPSAITGNTSNASYEDIRKLIQANTDADAGQSLAGNIAGNVVGGAGVLKGAGGIIGSVASKAAGAASPIISGAGNVLQQLGTLNTGERMANAAKLLIQGGAAGGAQAAGEGKDVGEGAAGGVLGTAALGVGVKAAQVLTRPVRDFLGMSSAGQILKRLTSATKEDISAQADDYRAKTGAEPTLFELLPLADRNKILKSAVVGRDNVVEATSNAIRDRAANLGPEMQARAQAILDPRRDDITGGILSDVTGARGGTAAEGDPALAEAAARSPTDMLNLRDQEVRAIMAPHDATPAVDNLRDLFPSVPGPNGQSVEVAPEVSAAIRSAAGPIALRPNDAGINVGEVTGIMSKLRKRLGVPGADADTAQSALDHLQGVLDQNVPEAGLAARAANDAYAARSRMAEGMQEGVRTRLRDNVPVGTNRGTAQTVRNAYDTPEGEAGRALGQGNQVLDSLQGSPEEALRATVGMSRNAIGRELAANVGGPEAAGLTAAARAQDTSAQALAAASRTASGSDGTGLDGEGLAHALIGLTPGSFITTKASALKKLLSMSAIPENRARTMVDMLFSQDPTLTNRALNALSPMRGGQAYRQYLAGVTGQIAGDNAGPADPNKPPDVEVDPESGKMVVNIVGEANAADNSAPEASAPAPKPGDDPNVPFGRAVISSIYPGAHITEDVRDPNSKLGKENPNSEHIKTQNAVDVRPIPGMTFKDFIDGIHAKGYTVIESRDEVHDPVKWATGPHWHVVVTGGPQ